MSAKMTNDIAFKLGKFDFPAFYSMVYSVDDDLNDFFEWQEHPFSTGRVGCLKKDIFTEISHKLNFVRGRLKGYSVRIEKNKVSISWTNSYDLRDLFATCAYDVLLDLCLEPPREDGGRQFKKNPLQYSVIKSEILGTIPGTPSVEIIGDEEAIKYLTGDS